MWANHPQQQLISIEQILGLLDHSDPLVYPNPAADYLELMHQDFQGIEFYNLEGKMMLRSDQDKVNVSGLPEGDYLVIIQTTQNKVAQKVLIRR